MVPTPETIFDTLDATWPAARRFVKDGWVLRQGDGGGQRVSAATAAHADASIEEAEAGMRALGQRPLFMVRPGEDALDDALERRGYDIVDPVTIYASQSADIAAHPKPAEAISAWPPLAIQSEIWRDGGVGPARIAIMDRATCQRTTFLGRVEDRPAATVYIGAHNGLAMLHALETRVAHRRKGIGRTLVSVAAQWAMDIGADWVTLAVVTENKPACALYESLGMQAATSYHYRRAPEA